MGRNEPHVLLRILEYTSEAEARSTDKLRASLCPREYRLMMLVSKLQFIVSKAAVSKQNWISNLRASANWFHFACRHEKL